MNMPSYISVVLPALNEEGNIGAVMEGVKEALSGRRYEMIVVDGRSRDKTADIARESGAVVIYEESGKGAALKKGLLSAKGDVVISIDADLSHDPKELPVFIKKIEEGYDVCMGSRFMAGGKTDDMSFIRFVGNKIFVMLVNARFGSHYTDMCYGYRSFGKNVAGQLELSERGFGIETEINIKAIKKGLKIVEVPSYERKRNAGTGKLRTFTDGWIILLTIIKNYF